MVFHGAPTTRTPLIAQMAMERQIAANILSASTQSIGDRVYGNMLLSIAGGAGQAREAAALQNIRIFWWRRFQAMFENALSAEAVQGGPGDPAA